MHILEDEPATPSGAWQLSENREKLERLEVIKSVAGKNSIFLHLKKSCLKEPKIKDKIKPSGNVCGTCSLSTNPHFCFLN